MAFAKDGNDLLCPMLGLIVESSESGRLKKISGRAVETRGRTYVLESLILGANHILPYQPWHFEART
jgi:hypothetical protein